VPLYAEGNADFENGLRTRVRMRQKIDDEREKGQ